MLLKSEDPALQFLARYAHVRVNGRQMLFVRRGRLGDLKIIANELSLSVMLLSLMNDFHEASFCTLPFFGDFDKLLIHVDHCAESVFELGVFRIVSVCHFNSIILRRAFQELYVQFVELLVLHMRKFSRTQVLTRVHMGNLIIMTIILSVFLSLVTLKQVMVAKNFSNIFLVLIFHLFQPLILRVGNLLQDI